MRQITDRVIMVRPGHFGFNAETAKNNTFQSNDGKLSDAEIRDAALAEFDGLVQLLRENGVHVDIVEDSDVPIKPDAVFPNNWFSTHEDGTVITYPMLSEKRRAERREEVIVNLSDHYNITKRYAFEVYEEYGQFLEGTGSLVLDRENSIAYACISPRTDMSLVEKFCVVRDYTPVTFHAYYDNKPVYHTNVVMALGIGFVVICLDCIPAAEEVTRLKSSFTSTGKEIITITPDQIGQFAGNMIQLSSQTGQSLCVMSDQAYESLTEAQVSRLAKHGKLLHAPVFNIEHYGGGSARCMIAENFLAPKPTE